MKASEIFYKTAKGQSEVESRTDALSMKERRVLILVNGDNNAAKLKELSLCDNIVEILETLLNGGFIEQQEDTVAAPLNTTPLSSLEKEELLKEDSHDELLAEDADADLTCMKCHGKNHQCPCWHWLNNAPCTTAP